ncbi:MULTISPECIES: hypothetical protein [unclassified Microcoleus]|uniref:hypothetical protein n=1 Tax=unclassified Microcoleus TaxID=2642155 RepID=UPI002FD71661
MNSWSLHNSKQFCSPDALLQASYFNDRRSSLVAGDRQLLKSLHQNFDDRIKSRSLPH